jgi:hypothetical protein
MANEEFSVSLLSKLNIEDEAELSGGERTEAFHFCTHCKEAIF